jgi:hypothetical protein
VLASQAIWTDFVRIVLDFWDIITKDEPWIHIYDPETKEQSKK